MSRYSPNEIALNELTDTLVELTVENSKMLETLEHIASDTEENRQLIAQQALKDLTVYNETKNKEK